MDTITLNDNFSFQQYEEGHWDVLVTLSNDRVFKQAHPAHVEIYDNDENVSLHSTSHNVINKVGEIVNASALIKIDDTSFRFEDVWSIEKDAVQLNRAVTVDGDKTGGFLSAFTLQTPGDWQDVRPFMPGMVYGDGNLVNPNGIFSTAHYENGVREFRVREDRPTAPTFGIFC